SSNSPPLFGMWRVESYQPQSELPEIVRFRIKKGRDNKATSKIRHPSTPSACSIPSPLRIQSGLPQLKGNLGNSQRLEPPFMSTVKAEVVSTSKSVNPSIPAESRPHKASLYEAVMKQFNKACDLMQLDPNIRRILATTTNEITVHFPVRMDDGRI